MAVFRYLDQKSKTKLQLQTRIQNLKEGKDPTLS